MTFTDFTHFPTFISLTQRKIHKPQTLKSAFLLPVIWGGGGGSAKFYINAFVSQNHLVMLKLNLVSVPVTLN